MERLEGEVEKFVMQKDFDGLNFGEFRKTLLSIELKLADFDGSLESSISDCYYEVKRVKDQLEELRPQFKKLEEVLEATKEVKLPFKFESTQNTFTIRLLDLNFVEALSDALDPKSGRGEERKKVLMPSPTKRTLVDRVMTDDEYTNNRKSSVQSLTERFNSSAFMKAKPQPALTLTRPSMSINTQIVENHHDPYELRKSAVFPPTRKNTMDGTRRLDDNIIPGDVNLNTCDNIYDLGRRLSGYKSFKVASVPFPTNEPPFEFSEDPTQTPSSKKFPNSSSTTNLILKKVGSSITRKSVVADPKKFPKYYSSVITLNDDAGVICNQVIDELRFRTILASLKAVPKHVRLVEMVNNVFKINPVPMLKSAFDSRLGYVLQVEVTKNQMMANLVYTKRDLEILAQYNIVLIN